MGVVANQKNITDTKRSFHHFMHSYFLTKRQPIHEKGIWFWTSPRKRINRHPPSTGRASVVFTVWLPPSIPFWQYSFQNLLHQTLLEDNVELLPIPQKLSGITVFFLCTPNWIQKLTWLHSQYTLLSVSGLYLSCIIHLKLPIRFACGTW